MKSLTKENNMKTVLASTYAVNPYKGSEDGMGWNYVMQLARFHKVIAITRKNNEEQILKYQAENPSILYKNIRFLYYDLPYWMRFWKRKSRGAMLYYYLWQKGIVSFVERQSLSYDFVHNLNFHNDWTPSFLWKLNKPFIWGPVGHHPAIPKQYKVSFTLVDRIKEKGKNLVKNYFWALSPKLKKTKTRADHIMCMNGSVPEVLNLDNSTLSIQPSVASQDYGWKGPHEQEKFTFLSAGRFVPLKGFDLTIHAFHTFLKNLPFEKRKDCSLILVGKGPQREMLEELVNTYEIADYVQFIPWIERSKLMHLMQEATGFIFPSHEGAGMVIPEALSFGLPCIVLDNWGPGQFINETCGIKVKMGSYEKTVKDLADGLLKLYKNPAKRKELSLGARERFLTTFHWDRKGEQLRDIYKKLAHETA